MSRIDLHIVGLVSIYLASKFEDVIPIHMHQILNDAGHNKYSLHEIVEWERDILKTLEYKIHTNNIYDETMYQLLRLISKMDQNAI